MSNFKIHEVSDCLRFNSGNVIVQGTIISTSRLYKLGKAVIYECTDCGFEETKTFESAIDNSNVTDKVEIKSNKNAFVN